MTTENWIDLNDIQAVAIAQSEGWEIEVYTGTHQEEWQGKAWMHYMRYRGRPRQPKMKEVKMECWINSSAELVWREESFPLDRAIRQPHLDMVAKVPE